MWKCSPVLRQGRGPRSPSVSEPPRVMRNKAVALAGSSVYQSAHARMCDHARDDLMDKASRYLAYAVGEVARGTLQTLQCRAPLLLLVLGIYLDLTLQCRARCRGDPGLSPHVPRSHKAKTPHTYDRAYDAQSRSTSPHPPPPIPDARTRGQGTEGRAVWVNGRTGLRPATYHTCRAAARVAAFLPLTLSHHIAHSHAPVAICQCHRLNIGKLLYTGQKI